MAKNVFPRIGAQQMGADIYLVEVDDKMARVCDATLHPPVIFPPFPTQSIVKQGYWTDFKGDPKLVDWLLDQATEVDQ